MIYDGISSSMYNINYKPIRVFRAVGSIVGVFEAEFPRTNFRSAKMEVMITIPMSNFAPKHSPFKTNVSSEIAIAFVDDEDISCDYWRREYTKSAILWVEEHAKEQLIEVMKPYAKCKIY